MTCSRAMALILCPKSLLRNWELEFEKWLAGDVHCVVADGGSACKVLASSEAQVLIVSYQRFALHAADFAKLNIDLLVADEAHVLKNMSTNIVQSVAAAKFPKRVLLTGTPMQNDIDEFVSLLKIAVPGVIQDDSMRPHLSAITRASGSPADAGARQAANHSITEIRSLAKPALLRRANDFLLAHLPPKLEVCVTVPLTEDQRVVYEEFCQRCVPESIRETRVTDKRPRKVVQQIDFLRKVAPLMLMGD